MAIIAFYITCSPLNMPALLFGTWFCSSLLRHRNTNTHTHIHWSNADRSAPLNIRRRCRFFHIYYNKFASVLFAVRERFGLFSVWSYTTNVSWCVSVYKHFMHQFSTNKLTHIQTNLHVLISCRFLLFKFAMRWCSRENCTKKKEYMLAKALNIDFEMIVFCQVWRAFLALHCIHFICYAILHQCIRLYIRSVECYCSSLRRFFHSFSAPSSILLFNLNCLLVWLLFNNCNLFLPVAIKSQPVHR